MTARAHTAVRARRRAAGPVRADRSRSPRPRPLRVAVLRALARSQLGSEPLRVLVVGGDDPLYELVTDDVLLAEADELDSLHLVQNVSNDHQARVLLAREVDLGDVAGHDHPRVEPEPGQEHLHL